MTIAYRSMKTGRTAKIRSVRIFNAVQVKKRLFKPIQSESHQCLYRSEPKVVYERSTLISPKDPNLIGYLNTQR